MVVNSDEILALVPVTLLSFSYLITDILTFNRLQTKGPCLTLTRVQWVVALVFYPVWIFLVWVENLSTKRGDIAILTTVGITNTIVGWFTTVYVFNDDFIITRQQYFSLLGRIVISSMWRWNNYLVFSS